MVILTASRVTVPLLDDRVGGRVVEVAEGRLPLARRNDLQSPDVVSSVEQNA
jgi:hypothetical protein